MNKNNELGPNEKDRGLTESIDGGQILKDYGRGLLFSGAFFSLFFIANAGVS